MSAVKVLSGSPDDRPPGFPCIGCGAQVTEERGVNVNWPDGRNTVEAICGTCAPLHEHARIGGWG